MSEPLKKTKVDEKHYNVGYSQVNQITYVIKVPFGWIVETSQTSSMYNPSGRVSSSTSVTQTFVSDPNHEWSVKEIE